MKEIGAKLKEARESIGVSIDEAAEDLKLRVSQIENIEAGNIEAFKDIFFLKYFIRDYSKYLGLNHEILVDEFNEYLFDYTSKISLEDIKKEKNKKEPKGKKKIRKILSPYTLEKNQKSGVNPLITYIFISILVVIIGYFIFEIVTM